MKSTERFSDRVENYVRYRPSYPDMMVNYIVSKIGGTNQKICADIGAGTGILTKKLAPYFQQVYAVEPNDEMRAWCETDLRHAANVATVKGTAEETTLGEDSVDLITVAQAFHWFDQTRFAIECRRILKRPGYVALIWNNRLSNTKFLETYDSLLKQFATDYNEVNHQNITGEQISTFYGSAIEKVGFPNSQMFDLAGVFGRLDSSSYAPKEGTEEFSILREEIKQAFERYSIDGHVDFNYQSELYLGMIS